MEERDTMEVDVLFVGGGVASLSGALHLATLIKRHNEKIEKEGEGERLEEIAIVVLEKGAFVGSHSISGAIMDPVALKELMPDFQERGAPVEGKVTKEEVCLLTKKARIKAPIVPPPLKNHGFYVVSLSKLTGWLGGNAEEAQNTLCYNVF